MVNDLIIETNELTKSYGPHVALDKLSIQVQRGATGLLGPNGAGKSTFFKTILGLIQATLARAKSSVMTFEPKVCPFVQRLVTCPNTMPLMITWMRFIRSIQR